MSRERVAEYVVGLVFSDDLSHVVLLRKRRSAPEHLAGRLSGPGGRVEDGEYPLQAMVREFHEETGVRAHGPLWRTVCVHHRTEHGVAVTLYVYALRSSWVVRNVRTVTDEVVAVHPVPLTDSASHLTPLLTYHVDQSLRVLRGEAGPSVIEERRSV